MSDSVFKDAINGILLGDGSLRRADRLCPNLHITQAPRHIDWLYLIQNLLLKASVESKVAISGKQALLWTKQEAGFMMTRLEFYPDKHKKRVPPGIQLSPIATLFWYIGDGSLAYGRGVSPQVNFATHGFAKEESELLGKKLNEATGVNYSVVSSGEYCRLNILGGKEGLKNLFFYMNVPGMIPESYRYKFRGFLF